MKLEHDFEKMDDDDKIIYEYIKNSINEENQKLKEKNKLLKQECTFLFLLSCLLFLFTSVMFFMLLK